MENKDLQTITRTETADAVLMHFFKRQRVSFDTDLEALRSYLIRMGSSIIKQDFFQLFHELENIGAGELIQVGDNKEAKFKWYYSLKDLANQALNLNKVVNIKPVDHTTEKPTKKRGRPVGYSPKQHKEPQQELEAKPVHHAPVYQDYMIYLVLIMQVVVTVLYLFKKC